MARALLILALLAAPLAGCTATDGTAPRFVAPEDLAVSSPTVLPGQPIPPDHTCDGQDRSPQLDVQELPQGTATVALAVLDPDAPGGVFVHWLVWDAPAGGPVVSFPEGRAPDGAVEGENGRGETGYAGPCPPADDPPHRYVFRAYAVDKRIQVPAGAQQEEMFAAMEGHVLAWGELVATYQR